VRIPVPFRLSAHIHGAILYNARVLFKYSKAFFLDRAKARALLFQNSSQIKLFRLNAPNTQLFQESHSSTHIFFS